MTRTKGQIRIVDIKVILPVLSVIAVFTQGNLQSEKITTLTVEEEEETSIDIVINQEENCNWTKLFAKVISR